MFTEGAASTRDELVNTFDLEASPYFGQVGIRMGDWKMIWGNAGWGLGTGYDAYILPRYPPYVEYYESLPPRAGPGGPPKGRKKRGGTPSFTFKDIMVIMSVMARDDLNPKTMDFDTGRTQLFNLAGNKFII